MGRRKASYARKKNKGSLKKKFTLQMRQLAQCTCSCILSVNNTAPCKIHPETPEYDVHSNFNDSNVNGNNLNGSNDNDIKVNESTLIEVPNDCSKTILAPKKLYKKIGKRLEKSPSPIPEKRPRKPIQPFIVDGVQKKKKPLNYYKSRKLKRDEKRARKTTKLPKIKTKGEEFETKELPQTLAGGDEFYEFAFYIAAKLQTFPIGEARTLKTYLTKLVDDYEKKLQEMRNEKFTPNNVYIDIIPATSSSNFTYIKNNDNDSDSKDSNDDGNDSNAENDSSDDEEITEIMIKEEVDLDDETAALDVFPD